MLELHEKLRSFADQQDESCESELQVDQKHSSIDSLENGELKTDEEQTIKTSGQFETSEHRFHEILNRELSMFCERMCTSRTGDVSNEQETNQRHDVAGAYEEDNEELADNGETDGKEPEHCSDNVDSNQDFIKEVDNLKRKLTEDLFPLLSSDNGRIHVFY